LEKFEMGKGNVEDFYPLSPMQQGMLFHTLYSPNSGVYFEQLTCTLRKLANPQAFKQAWQQVTDRHPILRTSFVWEGVKEPVQVVYRQVQLPWEECDWQGLAPAAQQQHLETFLKSDRELGFDMRQPPLMRMTLIKLAKDTYYFIWSHHHLLLDGWSNPAILTEVFDFYQAELNGEQLSLPRPRPYRDYIVWIQQQNLSEAESFWRQRLQGFTAPTPMPIERDFGSPAGEESDREQQILLSVATTAALRSLARQQQLTLNTLVQGAWGLLLSRYSGEEDVIFGTVVSGRPPDLAGVESMVGLFVNTQPARVNIRPKDSLLSWLKQLQDRQIEARQYEYSPLVEVQRWSEVPHGLPLFDTLVVFENYPLESSLQKRVQNLEIESIISFEKTNYALTLAVVPGEELALKIGYNSNRFEDAAIARMLGHLQVLLEGMVANPHQPLKNLPLLTPAEKQQILVEWNGTKADYPQDRCIHQLFEQQAERSPDAIAVVFEDQKLTYRELNQRANKLAHYLQKLGVKPEVLVGICTERSLSMVVGILGILKAGGAYIPMAPNYPQERLAYMLADSQVSVLLTQQKILASLPKHQAQVICLDADWDLISQEAQDEPVSGVQACNLAYIIYTSGSTGKPKGTMILHQGVVNYLSWCTKAYAVADADGAPVNSSISFDATITSLFSPLLVGRKVVLLPENQELESLSDALHSQNNFSLVKIAPAQLEMLGHLLPQKQVTTGTKAFIVGGEALSTKIVSFWQARAPRTKLINEYGPTETVVGCCVYEISAQTSLSGSIPIGRPIANTQLYILDRYLQPVPIGVGGELHIGGAGLARGYLNRSELTAEKFIQNPYSDEPDARLYKTGDRARYLPDGNIEYLGRIDSQVKIRGYRIELGEIEETLRQHSAVREAVAIARDDGSGNKRLVAYVIPDKDKLPSISNLRGYLQQKLPEYMVPSAFVTLESLPLTPNGKLDRRALPQKWDHVFEETAFTEPQTPTEKELAQIWMAVLELEKVGINESFFEIGGHSLMAMQLVSRVRSCFGVELALCDFFAAPTIQDLAELVEEEILANADSNQIDELLDLLENSDGESAQTVILTE
jgi:amino acid adenylation domain-containing protein